MNCYVTMLRWTYQVRDTHAVDYNHYLDPDKYHTQSLIVHTQHRVPLRR
jgi:hypothetical protein